MLLGTCLAEADETGVLAVKREHQLIFEQITVLGIKNSHRLALVATT